MSVLNSCWYDCYADASLKRRRVRTHYKKLRQMGILGASKQAKILDICCGHGEMLDLLHEDGFTDLTGVDVMPAAVLETYTKHLGWVYVESDALKLPFEKHSFDWILCMHALHHLGGVKNVGAFLDQAVSLLKPGGCLCVVDHFDSWLLRSVFWLIESPLGCVLPWTRSFRKQLQQEHDDIWGYLNQWPQVFGELSKKPFSEGSYNQKYFFFYFKFQRKD